MNSRKRALVVGANGFIGSHLVDELVAAEFDVTAFDRFSSGTRTFESAVETIKGDFLNNDDLKQAVRGQESVFHFLSTSTPATAESDPTFDVRTNVLQSLELMKLAVEAGVENFYFASTGGAIYGESGKDRYSELDPTLPVSPYAIGKLTIERYLQYYGLRFGIRTTALRISNPYGPRQHVDRKQGLIPIVLRQIALGKPVTQLGDGSMVRDYIYVTDLVRMISQMVYQGPKESVYNLGSGFGRSVTEVLQAIRIVTGQDFEVRVEPKPPTFVDRITLDTTRYKAEFGLPRLTEFETGIASTWEEVLQQCQ